MRLQTSQLLISKDRRCIRQMSPCIVFTCMTPRQSTLYTHTSLTRSILYNLVQLSNKDIRTDVTSYFLVWTVRGRQCDRRTSHTGRDYRSVAAVAANRRVTSDTNLVHTTYRLSVCVYFTCFEMNAKSLQTITDTE